MADHHLSGRTQLVPHPLAVGHEQALCIFERGEQLHGKPDIAARKRPRS
jgi:hypothetical protein